MAAAASRVHDRPGSWPVPPGRPKADTHRGLIQLLAGVAIASRRPDWLLLMLGSYPLSHKDGNKSLPPAVQTKNSLQQDIS